MREAALWLAVLLVAGNGGPLLSAVTLAPAAVDGLGGPAAVVRRAPRTLAGACNGCKAPTAAKAIGTFPPKQLFSCGVLGWTANSWGWPITTMGGGCWEEPRSEDVGSVEGSYMQAAYILERDECLTSGRRTLHSRLRMSKPRPRTPHQWGRRRPQLRLHLTSRMPFEVCQPCQAA